MTINKFAFEGQSGLRQTHDIDPKRSHVREVYSALTTQRSLPLVQAAARAFKLGHAPPSARDGMNTPQGAALGCAAHRPAIFVCAKDAAYKPAKIGTSTMARPDWH